MVQVEAAIVARLGAAAGAVSSDPELAALLPGGVHSRTGGGDVYPFLTLGLVRQDDDYTFTRAWRHRFRYNLSVTDASESIDAASAALERVRQLLQDAGPAELPMEDFEVGYCRRLGRVGVTPNQQGVEYQRLADEYRIEVYPSG